MEEATVIYTKVARILSPTEIVLAVGAEDGVKKGMEFIIYDLSETINDPETHEDLGQIELVKGRVIAEHVQEKITVAKTPSKNVERVIGALGPVGAFPNPFAERTIRETVQDQLKVEGAVAIQTDPVVRIGDRARSVS
jgi:hypothetical protein